jgi:hypothetical protein
LILFVPRLVEDGIVVVAGGGVDALPVLVAQLALGERHDQVFFGAHVAPMEVGVRLDRGRQCVNAVSVVCRPGLSAGTCLHAA